MRAMLGGRHSGSSPRVEASQRGQILVETAIVIPIVIFIVLGALQLVLIQHARIMTSYAAYAAARAGVVHDANWNVMRNAALVTSLPLYARTDGALKLLTAWGKVKAAAEIGEAVDTGVATLERLAGDLLGVSVGGLVQDVSLVEVEVVSPPDLFQRAREARAQLEAQNPSEVPVALRYPQDGREIDFDDLRLLEQHPELGRLVVKVRVLFPLRIPVINKVLFELWLAQTLLGARQVDGTLPEWMQLRGRITEGGGAGQYVDEAVAAQEGDGPLDDLFTTSQWTKELRTLRWVAENHGVYLVPLYATYAMQMQSNWFESNQREPVWFSLE